MTVSWFSQIGIRVGNEIDLSIVNRMFILHLLDEAEHEQKLESASQEFFERRRSTYERLARGSEDT